MKNNASKEHNRGSFLAGFIVGGLAGAAIALIFAPQSGANTRGQVTDISVKRTSSAATAGAASVNGFSSNGHHAKATHDDNEEQPRIILDNGTRPTSDEDEPAD